MEEWVWLERAGLLLSQGRTKDAVNEIRKVLKDNPNHADALALYARCKYQDGKAKEGIELTQRALQQEPENDYLFYLLAFGYYKLDQNDEAIARLKDAISLNPYHPEYFGLLSFIYLDRQQFQLAVQTADEGLQLDPQNLTCLNARGRALNKTKRADEAMETLQGALAVDPDNEFTHTSIGWSLLEKGKHREAVTHFRESLRIDPNSAPAKAGLKECMKARIAPYRWMLQFSFWIHRKGRAARWVVPIGLFLIVQLAQGYFGSRKGFEGIAAAIGGLYLVFVITSWLINPIANFILLFSKDGRYALTDKERFQAVAVVSFFAAGLMAFASMLFLPAAGTEFENSPLFIGIVCICIAVPLADLDYPFAWKQSSTRNKSGIVLSLLGILSIILLLVAPSAGSIIGLGFLGLFALRNWAGLFMR